MGAKAAISEEQYLHTSFPGHDQEYVDGELVERSLPDDPHGTTQALLAHFFVGLRRKFHLYARTEVRLKLRPGLYRIPDVSVFHPTKPENRIPDSPPFIAIEILSSDDRLSEVRSKLEEYKHWGVPHVWLVDPYDRRMYTCDSGLQEVSSFRIGELGLEVTPADIFE